LLGEPQAAVEADIDAKRVPGLEADMTTADHRVFVVVIEVKTTALFTDRLEATALASSTHGHGQTGFDCPQNGNQAAPNAVALSDVLNELFLAGLAGAQEVVRPPRIGGQALGLLEETMSQAFGMGGEVGEANLGGTEIGAHPLWRKQRTEAGMEAEAVPATQSALEKRTELVHKTLGNQVFG